MIKLILIFLITMTGANHPTTTECIMESCDMTFTQATFAFNYCINPVTGPFCVVYYGWCSWDCFGRTHFPTTAPTTAPTTRPTARPTARPTPPTLITTPPTSLGFKINTNNLFYTLFTITIIYWLR